MKLKRIMHSIFRFGYDAILCFSTWIVPKQNNLILLAPFYSDTVTGNLWPLLRFINQDYPEFEVVIISSDKFFLSKLQENGYLTVISGTLRSFIYSARASKVIADHNSTVVFFWGFFQALANIAVIQAWHGTGFKQIVLMDEKNMKTGFLYKLRRWDLSMRCRSYTCILASSEEDKERKEASFLNKNVIVTGYPKNDLFYQNNKFMDIAGFKKHDYKRIILYAPTFRDRGIFKPFSTYFYDDLQDAMLKNESLFLIKKHPQDKILMVPEGYNRIKDITDPSTDLQIVFLNTDLLITDYSNISIDFSLTGKPILFYFYDYIRYKDTCRSFYYDLEHTLPGPFIDDQDMLLKYISNNDWYMEPSYKEKYNYFRNRFHKFQDGYSSKRVVEKCIKGIN